MFRRIRGLAYFAFAEFSHLPLIRRLDLYQRWHFFKQTLLLNKYAGRRRKTEKVVERLLRDVERKHE